ncbi:MAG TPA: gliding motility protein GldM [Parafilimonas sp.]|nr:gliding motility protein GldM [Parafilimonas sp.]
MALPKEPRQKMINLMYLVLTALLALNVSAEILNAFKTVNNSLTAASSTLDKKNKNIFDAFKSELNDASTRDRASYWAPKAEKAQNLANQMVAYIEGLQSKVADAAGYKANDSTSYREDDLEAATRVMTDPGTEGKELRSKLQAYKDALLDIDTSIRSHFQYSLPIDLSIPKTNNKANQNDWAASYFYMTPAIAAKTILSKFENDVKNSEAIVVDYCHQQVGAVKEVFNSYQPLVGQSSNYVMPGQEMTITAGIGAYNTESKPVVTIDGVNVPLNANGVAEYKMTAGGTGSYTKHIVISYFNQATGTQQQQSYDVPYTVGSPTGASVSADAVKVFYVGLDNPISVSGGNVGDEKVQVNISNANFHKTAPGKYIVNPIKAGTNSVVTVTADGKPSTFEFKVKDVPDPVAKVGINKGGRMPVNDFKAQFGVRADLENFVFEGVKFNVTGYTIVLTGAGFPVLQFRQVKGASFDPVRDLIEKTKPGTSVTIDEINVTGPGGTRKLPPIIFNLY